MILDELQFDDQWIPRYLYFAKNSDSAKVELMKSANEVS